MPKGQRLPRRTVNSMELENVRHEKFAQAVAMGSPNVEAHRKAGYKGLRSAACIMGGKPNVVKRVKELKEEARIQCKINRQGFSDQLADCFSGKVTMRLDQLKAGEMLAKACGWNEAEKLQVTGQQDVIIRIGGVDIKSGIDI